jgi:hypothetical protein
MGKAVATLVALSLSVGCIHAPKNKTRGYVAGSTAVVLGGALAYGMHARSCGGGDFSENVSCDVGSGLVGIMGLSLAAAGLATIGITAFASEADR